MRRLLVAALLFVPALAQAQDLKDRFNIKVDLTGMFMTESQGGALPVTKNEVEPYSLAYADLRTQLDGRRLPGNFELHLDGRVRITGELDQQQLDNGSSGYTARGYLGGREYELRGASFMRRGESVDFAIGRQFVLEADAMKIDGARVWYRFNKPHWDVSFFAGGYPNPYSRSLTTDYQGANGYYGASLGGGADVAYVYDKFWGSFSAAVIYLGGSNDGGPLNLGNIAPTYATDTPRSFLNWVGYERFTSWLDIYHNIVLDMSGSGGAQLTRLDAFATARAGKHLTIQAGYDHMSSIAIDMYLMGLLQSRTILSANGFSALPSITNNLLVDRTAHDQARVNVDAHWGLVNIWAEGRLRARSIVASQDPQFVADETAGWDLGGDATIGVRDRGSLKGVRLGLWYTLLDQFRSLSHIVAFELGRSFLDERLSFDFNFLYARTRDNGAIAAANMMPSAMSPNTCNAPSILAPVCYGTRDGSSYETGLTVTGMLSKNWFALLDYRFVADDATVQANQARPDILTHVLLLRIQARY
jgi:hypothetical protein